MTTGHIPNALCRTLERFRAKWLPVRVKKTRQNKKLEPLQMPTSGGLRLI
jgi:hypothetical protein